ncbi:hypothetical protein CR513_22698, partial [Mucuna pruriens]
MKIHNLKEVANFTVKKVLIDQGSLPNNLCMSTFRCLQILEIKIHSNRKQLVVFLGECVDTRRVSTKPFKEGNISTHIKILSDVELDLGAKPNEKLEYISLTNEEHHTQIGEMMQGPH